MTRLLILLLLAAGCRRAIEIRQPPPVPSLGVDAGDVCGQAELAIGRLCPRECVAPGACADACRRMAAEGVGNELSPECVVDAGSVAAMRACGVECAQ